MLCSEDASAVWVSSVGTTLSSVLCSLLLSLQLLPGTSPRESEFDFCLNWDRFYVGTQCWSVWLLSLLRIPMQVLMGICKRTCWGFLLCQPSSLCRTGFPGFFWGLTLWDVGNTDGVYFSMPSSDSFPS